MKWRTVIFLVGLFFHLGGGTAQDCPAASMKCPSFHSDNGDIIEYIPKPIPSTHSTQQLFRTVPEQPEGVQRFYCARPACYSNPCLHGATCEETDSGFNCTCLDGFYGIRCEDDSFIDSVQLIGGTGREGRVSFTSRLNINKLIMSHYEGLTSNVSHLVCRSLGFRGAYATVNGDYYESSSTDLWSKIRQVFCPPGATNITDCWLEQKKSGGRETSVGVVCCPVNSCQVPGKRLGIESGVIPDSSLTASSCYSTELCTQRARLNGLHTWATGHLSTSEWLKIDFTSNCLLTGIITQGRDGGIQYVTSYKLSYSLDDKSWVYYLDLASSSQKIFSANINNIPVTNFLQRPIAVRYVRIHPHTYVAYMSMRLELIGYCPLRDGLAPLGTPEQYDVSCQPIIGQPLGIGDGRIPASSVTSSSVWDATYQPHTGKLDKTGTWIANNADQNKWVKVDLGRNYLVTGVITQGRYNADQWVTSLYISYSLDDNVWSFAYEGQCGEPKMYRTNFDRNSHVMSLLPEPTVARYVRIHVKTFYGAGSSMRYEILGNTL